MPDKDPAAVSLGSRTSDKKKASSPRNGALGGRPLKPLDQIPCTCGATDGKHKWTCTRKRTEYQRERRNK